MKFVAILAPNSPVGRLWSRANRGEPTRDYSFAFLSILARLEDVCGIAGFVGGGSWVRGDVQAILASMGRSLRHRGPDHSALWVDSEVQVGFSHNRLAIVDISDAGNQPMRSQSGRFVIIYNGEIYNHLEIRRELEVSSSGITWNGHSDTETLLAAIEFWGIRGALDRAVGMFAFALWDRRERKLILARDRLGEKPLYYGRQKLGGPFLFASELKAFRRHPEFRPDVDRGSLALLLRNKYIPAPFSIYRGIAKLPPGSIVTVALQSGDPEIETYWSATAVAEAGISDPVDCTDRETTDKLEQLLQQAVKGQMVADVGLGAFLSGGIDSSVVVALMQKSSPRAIRTFTIGFDDDDYNEAENAKAIARHLGTDHTELYVAPDEARSVISKLPTIYDEPFGDASQIPTYLVSALARQHVTVALSGDGGDELFGGYTRYLRAAKLWNATRSIPKPLRNLSRSVLTAAGWKHRSRFLDCDSDLALYRSLLSLWQNPADIIAGAEEPGFNQPLGNCTGLPIERMMATDLVGYLPNDILVKVDRAAMAASLETRVPFLDHRVVEFAWRIPLRQKIRRGERKWILRQLLYRHVPRELVERPKKGFGVPLDKWLRGPLRDWAETLLDERRLREQGLFDPQPIRSLWHRHLAGANEQYRLWTILMIQSWLEQGCEHSVRPEAAVPMAAQLK